ncbi:PepSY domain-containing protein [Solibacillus sp. CAU 1738]|uniref:PepSY domain-containing protein n=1 Tax=Solibacillus sp. CAU 1738 TaxID=3140363 RepID=UPI003261B5FB
MNKKLIITLLVASSIISYFLFSEITGLTKQQPMNEDEIRTRVENLYSASVQSIVTKEQAAIVSFTTSKGLYEVAIDRETGRASNLVLVHETPTIAQQPTDKEEVAVGSEEKPATPQNEESKQPTTEQNEESKQPNNTTSETAPSKDNPTKPNTQQPAKNPSSTATTETPKKPASAIISEQKAIQIALKQQPGELDNVDYEETDDGGYYEIDIEHDDGETTFIIHAITGKILSVEFDD